MMNHGREADGEKVKRPNTHASPNQSCRLVPPDHVQPDNGMRRLLV